ncbi:MAG: hypothetical protein DKT66_13670 [Candidatus Melainabacteria bacterium]|nr:MAG: hypothetical protein DKT66_13670 [Candidatus Melainabacteria bacterium]
MLLCAFVLGAPVIASDGSLTFQEKSLLEQLADANRRPLNEMPLILNWDLYKTFEERHCTERARKHLQQIYIEISKIEKAQHLSSVLIECTANTLEEMAQAFSPTPMSEFDDGDLLEKPPSPQFALAESLMLRRLRILDRLPATNDSRMYAHESMERWYESFGKKQEAKRIHQISKKLIVERMRLEAEQESARQTNR